MTTPPFAPVRGFVTVRTADAVADARHIYAKETTARFSAETQTEASGETYGHAPCLIISAEPDAASLEAMAKAIDPSAWRENEFNGAKDRVVARVKAVAAYHALVAPRTEASK